MRSETPSAQKRRDAGQAAIVLVVVVCVLFVATAAAFSSMGSSLLDRTRAQTAADAVALASLGGGRSIALELAGRHGVTVVSWASFDDGDGRVVAVVVRLGDATAAASATDAP